MAIQKHRLRFVPLAGTSQPVYPRDYKEDIKSLHFIIIRSFSQLWILNNGYLQQLGVKSPNDHLILALWLLSIILHSNYSLELMG